MFRFLNKPSTVAYVPEWFPGADFQKKAAAWKKHALDFGEDAYMFVKKALVCAGCGAC